MPGQKGPTPQLAVDHNFDHGQVLDAIQRRSVAEIDSIAQELKLTPDDVVGKQKISLMIDDLIRGKFAEAVDRAGTTVEYNEYGYRVSDRGYKKIFK